MARTTALKETVNGRQVNVYAGQGAVRQAGGSLKVYVCNACHSEVVWAESKRTGRKYLVNVSRGYMDQRFYIGSNVHKCDEVLAGRAEETKAARKWLVGNSGEERGLFLYRLDHSEERDCPQDINEAFALAEKLNEEEA